MLQPRDRNYSHITNCIRRGPDVEIVRWYSGPKYGYRSHWHNRLTPSSQRRLSIIYDGLCRWAH